ncbi:MAG: sulfurtransferase TusA family protein [Candidatus Rokubacteria bacterium]|nr:sulfurtransferase TusA family protein [Candidatus Rokubacteria bacterium]
MIANVPPDPHDVLDAGDQSCGDLAIALKRAVARIRSGEILKLLTRDPGARADVPAWCRITGHRLLWGDGSTFFIQRTSIQRKET